MLTSPLALVVLALFAVWMAGGLVTSIQDRLRDAKQSGQSTVLAVLVGVLVALPFDLIALGIAALGVVVWRAV